MRERLAARVSDRLDIQPEQTEQVLRTLAQLIKKQGERDGRVRVPGLGVFRQRSDTLTFEPDPALSDAVNGRYAGLETIRVPRAAPVSPPSMPPGADAEPAAEAAPAEATPVEPPAAIDEEVPAGVGENLVDEQAPAHAEEAPGDEEATSFAEEAALGEEEGFAEEERASVEAAPDETAREDVPAETLAGVVASADPYLDEADYDNPDVSEAAAYDALRASSPERLFEEPDPSLWAPPGARRTGADPGEPPPVPGEEAPPDEVPSAASFSRSPEAVPVPEEAPSPAVPAARPERRRDRPSSSTRARKPPIQAERRSFLPWILLALFLVVAVAGAYYLLAPRPPTGAVDRQGAGDAAPQDRPPETGEAATEGGAPAGAGTEAAGAAETQPAQETPEPGTEAPPAQVDAARPIDRAAGGYTLVVASRARQDQAETAVALFRQRLSGQAIPVDVLRGVANGVTRYRIGVGQVPTAEDALALKNQLGDVIPADAWITRVEPDN